MEENKNYVDILIRDLKKKKQILDAIQLSNYKQREILEDPNGDPDDFDKVVEEKAKLIEQLETLDTGFEQVYNRVKEELNEHKELYKEEIKEMQKYIRLLTEKSASVQVEEHRNKELFRQKCVNVNKQIREIRSSQKVVNQYYKNMMKSNFIDPQFLDNKK